MVLMDPTAMADRAREEVEARTVEGEAATARERRDRQAVREDREAIVRGGGRERERGVKVGFGGCWCWRRERGEEEGEEKFEKAEGGELTPSSFSLQRAATSYSRSFESSVRWSA